MRRAIAGGLVLCSVLTAGASGQVPARNEVKIVEESDLYCSLLPIEEVPGLRIKAAERMDERKFLHEGELFVFGRIPGDGLSVEQVMTILEIGKTVARPAGSRPVTAAFQKGRAKIVRLEVETGLARIEKECGTIEVGQALIPFVQREVLKGRDLGFASSARKPDAPWGAVILLGHESLQAGPGQMALVDLGTETGIKAGQQLTVFRKNEKDAAWQATANVVVVHAGPRVSAVKVLSARDAVHVGDAVQAK